jgi:hypothetical protein
VKLRFDEKMTERKYCKKCKTGLMSTERKYNDNLCYDCKPFDKQEHMAKGARFATSEEMSNFMQ